MLSALVLPLFAQESDNEDEERPEVVITTATKTEKDILNTSQLLQL